MSHRAERQRRGGKFSVTSGRDADYLAGVYGFENSVAMARSLPPAAKVADIGSGRSNLGVTITSVRPDVKWWSVDPEPGIANKMNRPRKPGPLHVFVESELSEWVQTGNVGGLDRVFSSWLLPHLALESEEVALEAVHQMAGLLGSEGQLFVFGGRLAVVGKSSYEANPEGVARDVVEKVSLGSVASYAAIMDVQAPATVIPSVRRRREF